MFGYECEEVSIVRILDFCFSSIGLETVAKGPDEEMMSFEVSYDVQTGRWLSPKQWQSHVTTAVKGSAGSCGNTRNW